jgi:superfamily II DNA or RNA helicase
MPNTYLSCRGYGFVKEEDPDLTEELRRRLTVKPYVNPNSPGYSAPNDFAVYCESAKKIYIPKAYGLKHFGIPTQDSLTDGDEASGLVFHGNLRPEQEEPVAAFLNAARDPLRRGGIISAKCGFGKTSVSLYIACQFKKKTIVICHKSFLLNQWRERISQFVPNARIGIIKQDKIQTKNCDIILASLQSLAMRDYDSSIFHGIYLTIIDEIHHTSAEVFSRALPKITAPVMLGLSATLKRADGLSKVFEWYVGAPVFISKKKDTSTDVLLLSYDDEDPGFSQEIRMWNGKLNVAQMITRICSYLPRNQFIIDTLAKIIEREPNRRTLILSDRREHLKSLEKMIKNRAIGSVGYYVGGMKESQLKESESKDVILGTFTMACVADTTVVIDPISGKEHCLADFQEHCKKDQPMKEDPSLVSMYPSTGSFHISHATRFGYSHKKPCLRIVHDLGDIVVSTDHKVYTLDGWKHAADLKLTDYLIAPRRLDIKARDNSNMYIPDLWVVGCCLGQECSDYSPDEKTAAHMSAIVKKSQIAHELCMIIMLQKKQHDIEMFIGLDTMCLPEEKIAALLGGLFDVTGTINGYIASFNVYSSRLANQIGTLLLRLYIRSMRTPCVKPGFMYKVEIAAQDMMRFCNIIEIRGEKKLSMIQNVKNILHEFPEVIETDLPKTTSPYTYPVKICRIEEVDSITVKLCDIEIPIHHSFLASGIVVHNSEGMDIPSLNTLILASPVSSIEQSVGRIQRQKEEDRTITPLVIDIWDQFSLFRAQGLKRQQFYKKNKYKIVTEID